MVVTLLLRTPWDSKNVDDVKRLQLTEEVGVQQEVVPVDVDDPYQRYKHRGARGGGDDDDGVLHHENSAH
jgi:hypothetical protein